jgi:hypothetical protein
MESCADSAKDLIIDCSSTPGLDRRVLFLDEAGVSRDYAAAHVAMAR